MLVGQIVYIFVYRKTYLKESNTFATLQPFYILFVNGLILLDVTDLSFLMLCHSILTHYSTSDRQELFALTPWYCLLKVEVTLTHYSTSDRQEVFALTPWYCLLKEEVLWQTGSLCPNSLILPAKGRSPLTDRKSLP
jgi:hypothetical protein